MILREPFYISSSLSPAVKLPSGTELSYVHGAFTLENRERLVLITGYSPGPLHNLQAQFADLLNFMHCALESEDKQEYFDSEELNMFRDCDPDEVLVLALEIEETENLIEE